MATLAIIGAGPGGLFTADFVNQRLRHLCQVTLFESSNRVGGKLATSSFASNSIAFETGTAELYDYSAIGLDPLRNLVDELGLTTIPLAGSAVVLNEHILREPVDISRIFGNATLLEIEKFHAQCTQWITPEAYYEGRFADEQAHPLSLISFDQLLNAIPDEAGRRYISAAVHTDLATEPERCSALNGIKNVLMEDPRYMSIYTLAGGLSRLPNALVKRIRADILLEHRVFAIETNGNKHTIHSSHNGRNIAQAFDMVVLAMPDHQLSAIEYRDHTLDVAMREHIAAYRNPGSYLRVSVHFDAPFWRNAISGDWFMLDAFGGCCVYDEGLRGNADAPVLGWLLAGDAANTESITDERALATRVAESLPRALWDGDVAPHERIVEAHVTRWVGAVNAQPGGWPPRDPDANHVPSPKFHPHIFVVGDYLFDATVNGVMDSADAIADLIAKAIPTAEGLSADYFALYDGERSYEESYEEFFDAEYTASLVEAVWDLRAPYKLLDVGSANGITLRDFAAIGIEAWGVENNAEIHDRTPAQWLTRNKRGDVRSLEFADASFDVAYETALCYLNETDLDAAVRELWRVTRHGVLFGSITTDMTDEVIAEYDLLDDLRTHKTLREWSAVFLRNGFVPAIITDEQLNHIWKIETEANEGGPAWYRNAQSFAHCFYTRAPRLTE
ncbi:MAG: FAD-dependent oxidoreductase [Gemmatimonadaceae bacterium]